MGHGRNSVCTSNVVMESSGTSAQKSCLPNVTRTNFTPMLGCLATEIQNTNHIIQEDIQTDWIRGGYPSRRCVRAVNPKYACRYTKNTSGERDS